MANPLPEIKMNKELKNNNVSLKSLISGTSYLFLENIALSSMPLGRGFLFFGCIQPFNILSDFIEINQLKEAFKYVILVTSTELIFTYRSLCLQIPLFFYRLYPVIALLAATIDLNQILVKVAKVYVGI